VPTSSTGGAYVDADPTLRKGIDYCYYVRTEGRYANTGYLSSLLNRSQELCVAILDQPCTPQLTILPANCDSLAALQGSSTSLRYANRLRWELTSLPAGCTASALYYRIFYRPSASGPFVLLDSTAQTTYTHNNLPFPGGCYQVQAVGARNTRSGLSNEACQENCVFFSLPNIFTPNGDGINDVYALNGQGFDLKYFRIYNRWGEKVFETNQIDEPWDGTYHGKMYEPEVFVYDLQAVCSSGEVLSKKGNITLIR
jgi:gliding motility-associated-like protein